ncbi:MAG: Ldh family oxidoreductase [Chloroflexi bacterium]|nr:Ldh family oxidoreductase [Chloroflexota bacterium]|tara:strand:+ start:1897 stop:3033 length:1137 start_codon:yes stop_codon:yes gene_type:complete
MLEKFHVAEKDIIRVEEKKLRSVTKQILMTQSLSDKDATIATDALIKADLRGVESHGVSNMLRAYLGAFKSNSLNPKPNWKVVKETPSCATINSDNGLGIVVAPQAMEIAVEKAKKTGAGIVTMNNCGHLGMLAYHSMIASQNDMIGTTMAACSPRMVPTYSSVRALGTNPISYSAPADKLPDFVFDAAMTSVAGNKIVLASRLDIPLSKGWIADKNGNPIMEEININELDNEDESKNLENRYNKGYISSSVDLLPFGATREIGSHKGYSMAVVVDILAGILNGTRTAPTGDYKNQGHFLAAYDINAFIDTKEFKELMDRYLQSMLDLPSNSEGKKVIYAGYLESIEEEKRMTSGIPLHKEVVDWFKKISLELKTESL